MKPDEFVDSNQPNTDQILHYLTSAARSIVKGVDTGYSPEGKRIITHIYNWLRSDLMDGNFKEFEKGYDEALRKYPDEASELYDTMYEHAGLGMDGTYEQFMAKCTDNGVNEAAPGYNKHSFVGKIRRNHELKGKVDSTFNDIGNAQKKGDHPGASKAFRKHERYANLERPGTWSKVKEDSNPTDTITMDVPLVIRLMEYAKEDAQDDMALHKVAEQLTSLSQGDKTLTMADYDSIVGGQVDETIVKTGSQYELKSHTGKNLGKYPTKAGAEKREKQVNYFKNVKEDASGGATSAGAFATGAVGAAKPKKIIRRKSSVGEGIDQVDEGYWDLAMQKFEKEQARRKANPDEKFEKNPLSHDKNGVYKGDKDLAGKPVKKVKEFKAPDAHPFNKRTDAELKGFVKDAPEAAASIKKRGGNPAKIEKDAVTANVIKQSRQNDPRK